jgi:transcriptional regulator with GAF, ATPase, and Fis domain
VRLIAATNHNLAEEVSKGHFRRDLYYRINVFPIEVPPLRERAEDIPLLVQAFVNEFGESMGKRIRKIPRRTLDALVKYPWPGNIRELRNVIENALIRSQGEALEVHLPQTKGEEHAETLTRREFEAQHILKVLERTGWRIKGSGGAAERLGMKPATLYSMMSRLGIPTRKRKDEMSN